MAASSGPTLQQRHAAAKQQLAQLFQNIQEKPIPKSDDAIFNGEPVKGSFANEAAKKAFLQRVGSDPKLIREHPLQPTTLIFSDLTKFLETKVTYNLGKPEDEKLLFDGFNDSTTSMWRFPTIPNAYKLLIKVNFNEPIQQDNSKKTLLSYKRSLTNSLESSLAFLTNQIEEVDACLARDSNNSAYFYLCIPDLDVLRQAHSQAPALIRPESWSRTLAIPMLNTEGTQVATITSITAPSLTSNVGALDRSARPRDAVRIILPFEHPPSIESTKILNTRLHTQFPPLQTSTQLHNHPLVNAWLQACLGLKTETGTQPQAHLFIGHYSYHYMRGNNPTFLTLLAEPEVASAAVTFVYAHSNPLPSFIVTDDLNSFICVTCGCPSSNTHPPDPKCCPRYRAPKPTANTNSVTSVTSQQEACRQFRSNGSCNFGDQCRYSHTLPHSSSVKAIPPQAAHVATSPAPQQSQLLSSPGLHTQASPTPANKASSPPPPGKPTLASTPVVTKPPHQQHSSPSTIASTPPRHLSLSASPDEAGEASQPPEAKRPRPDRSSSTGMDLDNDPPPAPNISNHNGSETDNDNSS